MAVTIALRGSLSPNLRSLRLSGKSFGDSNTWLYPFTYDFDALQHLRFPLIIWTNWQFPCAHLTVLEVDAYVREPWYAHTNTALERLRQAIENNMFPELKKLYIRAVAYSPDEETTLDDVMPWKTEGPLIREACEALDIDLEVDPLPWYDEETALMPDGGVVVGA
jgi:hypothetical protein